MDACRQILSPGFVLACLGACAALPVVALSNTVLNGDELMQQVYERHQQFPYIYEEQSLVMEDSSGARDTRRAKRYTRVEEDGTVRFLLLFDYPEEIRGVAVLAVRSANGEIKKHVYLPAYGEELIESVGNGTGNNFLGTDFSVENLTGENLSDYRYVLQEQREIEGIPYYVVDVYPQGSENSSPLRRHFVRQDNLYITLTHHYDRAGRLSRVQSHHDLKAVDGDMWRADMILMEDRKEQHQSLIKVSRRIFSRDYVPEEVFTPQWLFEHYPYVEPEQEVEEEIIILHQDEVTE